MPTIKKLQKAKRIFDDKHGSRAERHEIYDTKRWRDLRDAKFIENPICEMCLKNGIIRPADDIHHIQSFMSAPAGDARRALAFDFDNLMSLCKECHAKIHAGGMG